jgi:hypothetical protein
MLFAFLPLTGMTQGRAKALLGKRDDQAIVIYAGAGISQFTGDAGTPAGLNAVIDRSHISGSLRIMWHPGYLLRIGVETGFLHFYSYRVESGGTRGNTEVRAIPLLFVFSMPVGNRIHLYTGAGSYLMTTWIDYRSNVKSTSSTLGWMFAANFLQPITRRLGVVAEGKWMDAGSTRDAALSLQVGLRWRISKWR